MKNKEFYEKELLETALAHRKFAMVDNVPKYCEDTFVRCRDCKFYTKPLGDCINKFKEWLEEEHRPFNVGDIVEVSDDGKKWNLRYFEEMTSDGARCKTYKNDTIGFSEFVWKYCRKYGSLGGDTNDKS